MPLPPPKYVCARTLSLIPACPQDWTLDLRPESGSGSLSAGAPKEKADITLTMSDAVFAQLVAGKLNPQNVGAFLGALLWRGPWPLIHEEGWRCCGVGQVEWEVGGAKSLQPPIPLKMALSDPCLVHVCTSAQAFLMRKLKIAGSMGMAMKLTPVLEAAAPKSKL